MYNSDQAFWTAQAQRLMRALNAAWWGAYFLPLMAVASLLLALAILIARRSEVPLAPLILGYALVLLFAAMIISLITRRRFCTMQDALARLDKELNLYNQLSAAFQGVGGWPQPQPYSLPVEVKKRRLFAPLAVSACSILASTVVPIGTQAAAAPSPAEQPLAWQQLEQTLAELAESETLSKVPLNELREQLRELQAQQREQWFEQSSLEAGQTLKDSLTAGLKQAESALEALSKTLDQLSATSGENPNELKALAEQLKQQQEALTDGMISPNSETVTELQQFSQSDLDSLSAEQLNELKNRIQQGQVVLDQAQRSLSGQQSADGQAPDGQAPDGQQSQSENQQSGSKTSKSQSGSGQCQTGKSGENGQCSGQSGNTPGQGTKSGSPARGPGAAPLNLTPRDQLLDSTELKRVAPNEKTSSNQPFTTSLSKQAPVVDERPADTLEPGTSDVQRGKGGEAVWKYSTSPKEKEVLEKLFK